MTTNQTVAAEKQDGRSRDNPALAVLKHLATSAVADAVKAAIREVTIERLENGGAVAGLAALRAELFGGAASRNSNGGAASTGTGATNGGAAARTSGAARPRKAEQQALPLGDDEVEEEEVEDETPAPEPDERTPLRRPIVTGRNSATGGTGGKKKPR